MRVLSMMVGVLALVGGAESFGQDRGSEAALRAVERLPGFASVVEHFDERYAKDSVHSTLYVESLPDDTTAIRRGYYQVYVGESHVDHTVRWFTILVDRDLKRLLYYDVVADRTYPIAHWRRVWPATEFLKRK